MYLGGTGRGVSLAPLPEWINAGTSTHRSLFAHVRRSPRFGTVTATLSVTTAPVILPVRRGVLLVQTPQQLAHLALGQVTVWVPCSQSRWRLYAHRGGAARSRGTFLYVLVSSAYMSVSNCLGPL